jgi:hypothetical protein
VVLLQGDAVGQTSQFGVVGEVRTGVEREPLDEMGALQHLTYSKLQMLHFSKTGVLEVLTYPTDKMIFHTGQHQHSTSPKPLKVNCFLLDYFK